MNNSDKIVNDILNGSTSLGIEFGSTRVKAVLLNSKTQIIETSSIEWENYLNDEGYWTYDEESIWIVLQECFNLLKTKIETKYSVELSQLGSIGISGMMHGYLAFDKNGKLLVPFRTWRNSTTDDSSKILTNFFQFNIPQRFSISHLFQAILNDESHTKNISYITTLSGYIHWKLTGRKVLGIGDASGMFPIDITTENYDKEKISIFNDLIIDKGYDWKLENILPEVLLAGQNAGYLSKEGALLLDTTGTIRAGIPFCPPEGDAGTGMIATNSINPLTANVSAGTSAFAMIVLDENLSTFYEEIDLVTTPNGKLVAMIHTNNCSTEINSWMRLFSELFKIFNINISDNELFTKLFMESENSDYDLGNLILYGYHSGEHITSIIEGYPSLIRSPQSKFSIANLIAANLYSAFATLKIGLNILYENEDIAIRNVIGHGGIFKTPMVAQKVLAACMESQVSVFNTASNGGAWGIAILAQFLLFQQKEQVTLSDYLANHVFQNTEISTYQPTEHEINKFNSFLEKYKLLLPVVKKLSDISYR